MTHAALDAVLPSTRIIELLEATYHVEVDDAPRDGIERPGWLRVDLPSTLAVDVAKLIEAP